MRPKDAASRSERIAQIHKRKSRIVTHHRKRRRVNTNIANAPSLEVSARTVPPNDVILGQRPDSKDKVEQDDTVPRHDIVPSYASIGRPGFSPLFDDIPTGDPSEMHPWSNIELSKITKQHRTAVEDRVQPLTMAESPQSFSSLYNNSPQKMAAHVPETLSPTTKAEGIFNNAFGTDSFLGPFDNGLATNPSTSTSDRHVDVNTIEYTSDWPDHVLGPPPRYPGLEPLHTPVDGPEFGLPHGFAGDSQQSLFKLGLNTLEGSLVSDVPFSEPCVDYKGPIECQQQPVDPPSKRVPSNITGSSWCGSGEFPTAGGIHSFLRSGEGSKKRTLSIGDREAPLHKNKATSDIMAMGSTTLALRSRRSSNASLISNFSGISSAISRLSEYSAPHKAQMKSLVRAFSSSTFSVSSKRTSKTSPASDKVSELSKHHHPMRVLVNEPKAYPYLSELPGAFIIAKVNIFATHVDCLLEKPQTFSFQACEGCCLKAYALIGEQEHSVPHAVMRYKRGVYRLEDWSSMEIEWMDRFGNATLHVAAAMGADYQQLSCLIDRGAKVDHLNTAGQNFMHVLDPRRLLNDMPKLLEKLIRASFNFACRDVQGRTFLHVLNARYGINPPHFSHWLKVLLWRDNEGRSVGHDFVYCVVGSMITGSAQTDQLLSFLEAFNEIQEQERSSGRWQNIMSKSGRKSAEYDSEGRIFRILAKTSSPENPSSTGEGLMIEISNINAYDDLGETVLMAHVRLWVGVASNNEAFLRTLVNLGASTTQRNREFASPLHLAIESGNIVATRILLDSPETNIHARDWDGKGVIAVGEAVQRRSRHDLRLYARIAACIVLAIDAGAILKPSLFDEWSLPKHRSARKTVVDSYSRTLQTVTEHEEANESVEESLVLPGEALEPVFGATKLALLNHDEELHWADWLVDEPSEDKANSATV